MATFQLSSAASFNLGLSQSVLGNWLILSKYINLSHNNPCFQCNIASTNFLVSHTCEIRFYDDIDRSTVHVYIVTSSYAKKFQYVPDLNDLMSMFWTLILV